MSAAQPVRRRMRLWWRRSGRPRARTLRWPVAGALTLAALVLGALGHRQAAVSEGEEGDWALWVYQGVQLFALEGGEVAGAPLSLAVARLLAPAVAGYAAWQALSAVFRQQITALRVRFISNHVVVCGLGEKGRTLALSLADAGHRVVGVEQHEEPNRARALRDAGLLVLLGDATSPAVLRGCRIHRARHLVAVCADDGSNAEIVGQARRLVEASDRTTPLTVHVHMFNADLTQMLRAAATARSDAIRLEFFNVNHSGARALVESHPPFPEGAAPPHVLIAGFGDLAQSVLQHIALRSLANPPTAGAVPRITILAADAEMRVAALARRSPQIALACTLVPVELDAHGGQAEAIASTALEDGPDLTRAYVCLEDDAAALTTGLAIASRLGANDGEVVVALRRSPQLGELVERSWTPALGRVHSFPLLEHTCTADLVLGGLHEALARSFHQGHLARIGANTDGSTTADVPFDDLSESLKESNRRAAAHIGRVLEAAGYVLMPFADAGEDAAELTDDEVETMAELEHERWRAERVAEGYTLGERDHERKTNPALLPWAELDEQARDYNRQWARDLPRHLLASGLQIRKLL